MFKKLINFIKYRSPFFLKPKDYLVLDYLEIPILIVSDLSMSVDTFNLAFKTQVAFDYDIKAHFLQDNPGFINQLKIAKKEKKVKSLLNIKFKQNEKEIVLTREIHILYQPQHSIYICYFYPIQDIQKTNFSILSEYLPMGVVIHQNERIVYANQTAMNLLEVEHEKDLIGQSVFNFITKDFKNTILKRIEKIYKEDIDAPPLEETLLTIKGKPFYAEVKAKKILWNEQPAILVLFSNISNQVLKKKFTEKTMQLLQRAIQEDNLKQLLKDLIDTFEIVLKAPLVCLWFHSPIEGENKEKTFIFDDNDSFHIVFTNSLDSHQDFILELLNLEESPIRKVILQKKPIFYRNIIQEIEDSRLKEFLIKNSIISYWIMPLLDGKRQLLGVLISYFKKEIDVSEIDIEYFYQASFLCSLIIEKNYITNDNYLLSQISRKSNEYVLLLNHKLEIIWYNDKFQELFSGIKEIKSLLQLIKLMNINKEKKEEIIKKLLIKKPFKITVDVFLNQEIRYLNVNYNELVNELGENLGYYCIIQDITKEMIYEKQLIEAKNIAERNAKIKSEFLSIMSHEIRTPLNVIIAITQILMENQPREDQIDELKLLKSSSEHLLNLVNEILDYSKIESNKLELKKEHFSLIEMLNHIAEMVKTMIKDKKIQFVYNYDENLPQQIISDPLRINQILYNLLSNAIKFTEEGIITLRVEKLQQEENITLIRFIIEDTGIGIPESELRNIFEPFIQLNVKPNRKYSGTGLGLFITKKLIELLEGKINIESKLNEGTKITVDIPFLVSKDTEIKISPKISHQDLSHVKVLIVDDYYPNLLITQKFLSLWKINSDYATNGEEAIHKVKQNHYDIILMDLYMPVIDGYTATKKIREFDKDVAIIAVTATFLQENIEQYGLNDILIKPFRPDELYQKIIKYIQKTNFDIKTWDPNI